MNDQDLYKGLVRIHILHHASEKAVFGLWFIEELGRHGYKLSPGTLYPILHGMEENGYLHSSLQREGRLARRIYRATLKGKKALAAAKEKVSELFGELSERKLSGTGGRLHEALRLFGCCFRSLSNCRDFSFDQDLELERPV
jgi:DNA-binding PadR family transcriptional regulator